MKSMNVLKLCWVIVVATACTGVPVQKSTDTVLKFFEVTNVEQSLDLAYGSTSLYLRDTFLEQDLWPEDYTDAETLDAANTLANMTTELIREHLSWSVLKDSFVGIYQKHFSERELLDAIAYYKSESGRSVIEKAPAIITEFMNQMENENLMQLDTGELLAILPSTVLVNVEIYKKHLTEKEYLEAVAYYGSETGQSMAKKSPAAVTELTQLILQGSTELDSEIDKMMMNFFLELE